MRVEEKILLEENELKPNQYIADAILCTLIAVSFIEIFNELGIFHVNQHRMRVCCFIALFCSGLIQPVARIKSLASRSATKYFVMALVLTETLIITAMLAQWAELLFALPLVLALQYHNKKLTLFAIIGTFLVAFISAPLSIYLALPQLNFYDFLIRSIGYKIESLIINPDYNKAEYMLLVIKYVSIPRCIIVAAYGPVSLYITGLVSRNIKGRADATYYSETDILTGLPNRFAFEKKYDEYEANKPEKLFCVYADADGLHEINNTRGHAAGDALLKNCAEALQRAFGENSYRLGGDEFLSFTEDMDEEAVFEAAERLSKELSERAYHISIGISSLAENDSIDALVKSAESRMFEAKELYHSKAGLKRA